MYKIKQLFNKKYLIVIVLFQLKNILKENI